MHVEIAIVRRERIVVLGSEASEPILIDVAHEVRIHLCHQHIDPQIKLFAVYKHGPCVVLLYYVALVSGNVSNFPRDENPLPLALVLGLHNHGHWCFPLAHVVVEVEDLIRRDPSLGKEGELVRHLEEETG